MLWIAAEILIVVALVAAPEPPQPDWESLLRDPAADVHWNADGTLWLLPRGMGGTVVEVDPRTGARTERGSATAGIAERSLVNEELRSVRGARQSRIRFSNESAGAVELLWVDTEGDRRSYGTLGPAEVREQHTFAGHAWEVRDASGSTLGYVRGDVLPTVLHIGAAVEKVLVPAPVESLAPAGAPATPSSAEQPAAPPELPADAAKLAGPALWAPGFGHVVVFERVAAQDHPVHLIESSPTDQVEPRMRTIQYLKPGDQIEQRWPRLFARDGHEVLVSRELFGNPWSIEECRWSADGTTFFFTYNQRGHQVFRQLAMDAATGTVRTVTEETSPTFIDYQNKVWTHWIGDDELLWTSERDGFNHVYLIDVAHGTVKRQVTRGAWMVRAVESVDEVTRTLVLRVMGIDPAQDPYYEHFVRVSMDGGDVVRLTQGDGTHVLEWSPDRAFYVDTWSRVDLPPVHELRRGADGSLVTELGRADASALVAAGWTWPERCAAVGRDGATLVYGVIWRPCGSANDSAPRPVLEDIYAGPHDYFVPKAFAVWNGQRRLTQAGFVVVQVDGMGTNWRGKAFHDVCWKNLKDAGLPDHVAWLRAAAATRPWMNLSRVGIYGGSAGGQSAMRALLDFPDVYAVAVADCGCHDNRMDKIWWNELWMGWPVDESYLRSSNVVDAAKLQGKLMLIVGELDENVDPASTLQVSAALVRAGKAHELVVVPGAGHGAAETAYGSAKRLEFLQRHLQSEFAGKFTL
jgi:dipeptidyl aminopeptidase/acylaminoacyl peptidase